MLVRTFSADTADEALERVRQSWGDDAIILSTYESPRGRGAEIRATIDPHSIEGGRDDGQRDIFATTSPINQRLENRLRSELIIPRAPKQTQHKRVSEVLTQHGVQRILVKKISDQAEAARLADDILALGSALDSWGLFDPIPRISPHPTLLFGLDANALRSAHTELDDFQDPSLQDNRISVATLKSWRASNVVPLATRVKKNAFEPILVSSVEAKPAHLKQGLGVLVAMGGHRVILTDVGATEKLGTIIVTGCHPRVRLAQVILSSNNGGHFETLNPLSLARLLLNWPQ